MSLADSIYEANESQQETSHSLSDQLVEKAVEKSIRDRPDQFSVYQLHLRSGMIYLGHEKIKEIIENVYRLTEYEDRIPVPILILFWQKLKRVLPTLDTSIIQISDDLFWDKDNGKVINKEEVYERYQIT